MRRFSTQHFFAGSALSAVIFAMSPAMAQTDTVDSQNADSASVTGDIIVTARRKAETVLDVPQTINAVSGDTIEKLRINNAADLAQIVPGISIEGGSNGASGAFGSSSSIRGVPTFLNSNASPVVQFYLNDAATGRGPEAAQSLFDVGQVEVLKGPQGTLRGRSTPSGAITITTRRPNLSEAGGYADISGTDRSAIYAQAAFGLPIIRDVLAIRIAGVIDHNSGNGVTSVNYRAQPFSNSEALRGTLRFQPSDNFSATVMYQKLWRRSRSFAQVIGGGNGLNGPLIVANDRLGITDGPNMSSGDNDFLTGQFEWKFAGQKLNYIGLYRSGSSTNYSAQDQANVVRGGEYYQVAQTPGYETSHELRLSSEEWIANIFDYTVGVYYDREVSHSRVRGAARFLSGAFGRPGTPVGQNPVDRYTLFTNIAVDPVATEKSVFGSVTAHVGKSTELSVGARYINFERRDVYSLDLTSGFNAITNPSGGFIPCAGLGALSPQLAGLVNSPIYSGVCDLGIPGQNLQSENRRATFNPVIYNVSLSRKFGPDFMVYANVGSAFRSAGPQIGITSKLNCCTDGATSLVSIENLIFQKPEKSTTYEIGFKASLFERRLQLAVAAFHQDFKNYFYLTQSTRYLSITTPSDPRGAGSTVASSEFTTGADAKVDGIDVEATVQIMPKWSANLGFTLSNARLNNALVPCNDSNFDGVPDAGTPTVDDFINNGVIVARCRSNASIARTPKWNLTLQSEYAQPVSSAVDAFIRGSFSYYPDNPNASEARVIKAYSLLNMYVGARESRNGWEVSLFANNLLNTKRITAFNAVAPVSSGSAINFFPQGVSNYNQIAMTAPQEFGVRLRYAFGAR